MSKTPHITWATEKDGEGQLGYPLLCLNRALEPMHLHTVPAFSCLPRAHFTAGVVCALKGQWSWLGEYGLEERAGWALLPVLSRPTCLFLSGPA